MDSPMPGRIVALVPDLLVGSRIDEAARRIDAVLESIGSDRHLKAALAKRTDVLIIDLGVAGLDLNTIVAEAKARNVSIVAFGPHVDIELLKAAKDAGMDNVYPRSAFLKNLHKILSERIPNASGA